MKVLLTGATGFVGRALASRISSIPGLDLSVALRKPDNSFENVRQHVVGEFTAMTDWSSAIEKRSVVIHTAARVHVMAEKQVDALSAFRAVNVDGTLNLAFQAARAGVKRFVFISSIKVNGEGTKLGRPYSVDDSPAPVDAYGISKFEAEEGLRLLSQETGLEVVIIRAPLVYGPGVKGNFKSLMHWVVCGLPLPFGGVTGNRRSLVSLDNLVDLILVCAEHPKAANQTFLVSDGEDLSTVELLQRMGVALKRPARLLCVPVNLLNTIANILGKKAIAQRLLGSLQVDISHTRQTLGWNPSIGVDEGLRRAVKESENDSLV